uniref:Leucine-rich repeat flightless-interacting protein 2 n=1 Tax=Strigamia maritima TaxID=126957 RepID=T1JJ54_STRMM
MSTPVVAGRRRTTSKLHSAAEDQALDIVAKEAETRLAARRAARAEARDIRMRELEKQQKEADEQSDRHYDLFRDPVQSVRQASTRSGSQGGSSYAGSRRSSEDSTEMDGRDFRHQLNDLEEKFRKAMISNAQMDNEKSTLAYQVDVLKDEFEELEENYLDLQREHKLKCRDHDKFKRDLARIQKENESLQFQVEQRDKLIEEHGLVLVTEDGDDDVRPCNSANHAVSSMKVALVSQESAHLLEQAGEGSLDVRLKRFAEEKQDLIDEIRRLKIDLEDERHKNSKIEKLSSQGHHTNGPDLKFLEMQREANKLVSDYKFRLQKTEQEVTTLQGSVARLESQVTRFKSAAEASEKVEDELKADKRKFQRELREAQSRIEELETSNNHLQKRIDKLKSVRNTFVK